MASQMLRKRLNEIEEKFENIEQKLEEERKILKDEIVELKKLLGTMDKNVKFLRKFFK
jgi:tetrahydromethanopterin S-methyltransferase subunit G